MTQYHDSRSIALSGLWEILSWARPQNSETQAEFCARYLEPVFGPPDAAGNYIVEIPHADGRPAEIMFTAHHDTVHFEEGRQEVILDEDGYLRLAPHSASSCLGADCGTGVWLILEMMAADVPGLYCVFADEEAGGRGSEWAAENRAAIFDGIRACISFDRKGKGSVITHQSSGMTASDDFAESLADVLGLGMVPDDGGIFTDSNSFAGMIGECTNISVGYENAHSACECQDVDFAWRLRCALIAANWNALRYSREPGDFGAPRWAVPYYGSRWDFAHRDTIVDMVERNPEIIAAILEDIGYDEKTLAREIASYLFADDEQ